MCECGGNICRYIFAIGKFNYINANASKWKKKIPKYTDSFRIPKNLTWLCYSSLVLAPWNQNEKIKLVETYRDCPVTKFSCDFLLDYRKNEFILETDS